MLASSCATPVGPGAAATPMASILPPYPPPATNTLVVTQTPLPTVEPSPTARLTNTLPPPPNPSRIPTQNGPTRTPTPERGSVGTAPPLPPTLTLFPFSKITDKAPALPEDQKAKVYIRHLDGTYELLLIDYSIKASTYLQPGDELIAVIPPTALVGHVPPPPQPSSSITPSSAPSRAPYSLPTR
jgi:hypothetical protein